MAILIGLEGPDMTGKSEIAAEMSKILKVPVFKNKGEWYADLRDPSYFKNLLIHGSTFLTEFLLQTGTSVLMDRNHASEWVYAQFFNRDTDFEILRKIDEKFAEAGGKFVICRRKSYAGIRDDLHDYIDEEALRKLDGLYAQFQEWTSCECLTLWVDDENLEREISEIFEWMKWGKYDIR